MRCAARPPQPCLASAFLLLSSVRALNPADMLPDFLSRPLAHVEANVEGVDGDQPFTIVFVADTEPRMRGNTDDEVKAYVANLVAYKSSKVEYFEYGDGSTHRIDPSLVIIAGDISKDHSTSNSADMPIWQQLEDHGIPFICGFGNHDWEDPNWYAFSGDGWNRKTTDFCRDAYKRAANIASPHFGYREFGPTGDLRGPVTFLANFKGVQIVNFNTFLYQPRYSYDLTSESGKACLEEKLWQGFAGCQVYSSAEPQISELEAALSEDVATPTLFVQHYPITTNDRWWDDWGASGTTIAQKKQRLKGLIGRYNRKAFFSGHHHRYLVYDHDLGDGKSFREYLAPYFGGNGDVDLSQGGGFLAILVSKNLGILEVKHVATPLAGTQAALSTTTGEAAITTTTGEAAMTTTTGEAALTNTTGEVAFTTTMGEAALTTTTENLAAATTTQISGGDESSSERDHDEESSGDVQSCSGLSILPRSPSMDSMKVCVVSSCSSESLACSSDPHCKELLGPLAEGSLTLAQAASVLWAAQGDRNVAVGRLGQCLDANCGTSIGTAVCIAQNGTASRGHATIDQAHRLVPLVTWSLIFALPSIGRA